jgi:tetratricopeptide (TPR) repeat protein
MALGQLLQERADELGAPKRMIERSQYHLVRSLELEPDNPVRELLVHDLGVSCLRTARTADAHRLFMRLLDKPKFRRRAQYYLGLVSYKMGKYKNAILYFQQHLKNASTIESTPKRRRLELTRGPAENPRVHARIGMAYLQLGEPSKAREACNQALALDPTDLYARWTLGCAMLEENEHEEAIKVLREILEDAPDHVHAFAELVRVRIASRDVRWLRQALRSEVAVYDRLPVSAWREDPTFTRNVRVSPRRSTRERVNLVLDALREIDEDAARSILQCVDLTTDEGLRFALWESALDQIADRQADELLKKLRQPARHYGPDTAREMLTVAHKLPENLLTQGLQLTEDDLKRAAVDRNAPEQDVSRLRVNIDQERRKARAWQALLLLCISTHESQTGRNLLVRFASDADDELSAAARAGLAMWGDREASEPLRERARGRGAEGLLDQVLAYATPPTARVQPRPVSDDESACCATCGRRTPETDHMLAGAKSTVCNLCMTSVARERRSLAVSNPEVSCNLCGATTLDASAIYMFRGVPICSNCVDLSLGLQEREAVDRFLTSW